MWIQVSFVLSQSTRLTDGGTDRRVDGRLSLGYTVRCITCNRTVKCFFYEKSINAAGFSNCKREHAAQATS